MGVCAWAWIRGYIDGDFTPNHLLRRDLPRLLWGKANGKWKPTNHQLSECSVLLLRASAQTAENHAPRQKQKKQ